MVERFFSFINKETNGVEAAAYLLAFFAVSSQILALVRDKLLAFSFGASHSLDLYYAAFRIPDFLFVTVGSLVSLSVLVPFYTRERELGAAAAKSFLDSVFTSFLICIVAAAALAFVLMPTLVSFFFPGFTGESRETITLITRILLLSPVLLGVSNLFGTVSQVRNRFFVYALSPLLYNLGIIIGVVALYPLLGVVGLALGVVIGALLHASVQLPTLLSLGSLPRLVARPDFSLLLRLARHAVPRTVTLSFTHIAIFILLSFASLMPAGSISIFSLAYNLQSVPLSIIGVSYSLAAFPALSRFFASGEKISFLTQAVVSARHIIFWSAPATVFFIVLRAHIVRVVLGAGEFGWNDTRLTAAALALFVVSVVFQSLTLLFLRALYASGLTGRPFWITAVSSALIVFSSLAITRFFTESEVFRYFLESLLKVADLPGTVVLALPLGFTLGSILEGVLIWRLFAKRTPGFSNPVIQSFFQNTGAAIVGGFAIYLALRIFDNIFSLERFWGVFFQAALSALVGLAVWMIVLRVLRNQEQREVWQVLHKRFWKAPVIGPDTGMV
ncbi:hypothetical protein EPN83_00075 [Patescibacteria group bacterium]|nr:MAG: hypothetical protein EPN83_00075 [Patescibacteria group bacterium]